MPALTIAMAKGRLLEPTIALLESIGYDLSEARDTRKLVIEDRTRGTRFLFAKPMDVPIYVEYGAADAGVVGLDALRESGAEVYEPLVLGYGRCRLVVAGKPEHRDAEWRMLAGVRVATQYPNMSRRFFSAHGLSAEIIRVYGSVELAPSVGLSDLIVDVVQSGRTLLENGLVELDQVLDSEAALIVNRASHTLRVDEIRKLKEEIGLRLAGPDAQEPATLPTRSKANSPRRQ